MTDSMRLPESVGCPACFGALESQSGEEVLGCASCGAEYPLFDGLPWLYRDVPGSRAQWAAKLQLYRSEVVAERDGLEASLGEEGLLPATRRRLERQKAGVERQGEQVFRLLEPFAFSHGEAGAALPKDRIPSKQHVTSYLETAFRDWCWGEEEVAAALSIVDELGAPFDSQTRALVLGGGAGRLSDELGTRMPEGSVVQLDLNPLLTRIGALASRGEVVELVELPRFPVGVEDAAVDQRLAREGEARPASVHYLLGDVFAPPIVPESIDLLVTPWFIDILPEAFSDLARRLGSMLREGGRWISFGPTSFEAMEPEDQLTPEEMAEALAAAGFEVEQTTLRSTPYLHSPHGMPRRGEQVFAFAAARRGAFEAPTPFSFYPDWLLDDRVAIPDLSLWDEMRAERTFDVEILKCIDGRASIQDIVVMLSNRYNLPKDRCRNTINRFFSKLIEGNRDEA